MSNNSLRQQLQHCIDFKTKPLGALGLLENLALQIGLIQQTLTPVLTNPILIVFAGDHGSVLDGELSAYPQEVTFQMVMNFIHGGAGINVFCAQHQLDLKVVDAGVNGDFDVNLPLIHHKVAKGTRSFLTEPAMTAEQLDRCFDYAKQLIQDVLSTGCNVIGFGEMGIGNTSSASLIMHAITKIPLTDCVGRGTGVNDQQYAHKLALLKQASDLHQQLHTENTTPLQVLQTFGGFEIAQMCASMLEACEHQMTILVDGFIATSAFLVAFKTNPRIKDYAVFCHLSDESGHRLLLAYLDATPILRLNLRLGEGSGCALAYPLVQSAVLFLNQMASFDSAQISQHTSST